jgi:hypothetical protein
VWPPLLVKLGEHAGSVAKEIPERNTYCQHLKEMKLPVQEIQKDAAKCLILLGSRGQKTGKTEFGVELGGDGQEVGHGSGCLHSGCLPGVSHQRVFVMTH